MRTTIGATLVLLVTVQAASAQQPAIAPAKPKRPAKAESFSMVLAHAGYFVASDSAFKNIYGNGLAYGGEFRFTVPGVPGEIGSRLVGWFEGSYRQRTGSLSFTQETTKVNVTAVEGGALYRLMLGPTSPYVGGGVGYYVFDEKNVIGEAKQNKAGFCGVAGLWTTFKTRWVVDLRVKYSTAKIQPADFAVDIGGATVGVGAGVRF